MHTRRALKNLLSSQAKFCLYHMISVYVVTLGAIATLSEKSSDSLVALRQQDFLAEMFADINCVERWRTTSWRISTFERVARSFASCSLRPASNTTTTGLRGPNGCSWSPVSQQFSFRVFVRSAWSWTYYDDSVHVKTIGWLVDRMNIIAVKSCDDRLQQLFGSLIAPYRV